MGDGGDECLEVTVTIIASKYKLDKQNSLFCRCTIASIASSVLPVGFKGRNWALSMGVVIQKMSPLKGTILTKIKAEIATELPFLVFVENVHEAAAK